MALMINAADPQKGSKGLDAGGEVGVDSGTVVDVGAGVTDISRFMSIPASP